MFTWLWPNTQLLKPHQRMLGPAANALMKASRNLSGLGRVGVILHLEGPVITLEKLNQTVHRLQERHPVLRSRLKLHPTVVDCFIAEEDVDLHLNIEEIDRKREDHLKFWFEEWKKQEKQVIEIGDGFARLWLLQDRNDTDDEQAPREIVIMCEHSVCDGLSLSNLGHELLLILSSEDGNMLNTPLEWPISMEDAIRRSTTLMGRCVLIGRFIGQVTYSLITNRLPTILVPFETVNFSLNEMDRFSHTIIEYGILDKDLTDKLLKKCREKQVTVTSAVMSALVLATNNWIEITEKTNVMFNFAVGADTRRRCSPVISNQDLSYHVANITPFTMPSTNLSKLLDEPWTVAEIIGDHMRSSINAGNIFGSGLILGKLYELAFDSVNLSRSPTYGISSWGILPFIEDYGRWKLVRMSSFVNMVRGTMPLIVIETVNGVLTMMFGATAPLISRETLEYFRNETLVNLNKMMNDQQT